MISTLAGSAVILVGFFIAIATVGLFTNKSHRDKSQFVLTYIWRMTIVFLLAIIILKL